MKKNKMTFNFEHYMILKTITVLCFVFSLLLIFGPFITLILKEHVTDTDKLLFYYHKLFNFYLKNYFATIPLFIGAFLFVYLFLMKKLKEPDK